MPRKLPADHLEALRKRLQRRHELLTELRAFSVKRLAAEFGVSHMTVRRLSEAQCGAHLPDEPNVIENSISG